MLGINAEHQSYAIQTGYRSSEKAGLPRCQKQRLDNATKSWRIGVLNQK
jgi:hypothetical protein